MAKEFDFEGLPSTVIIGPCADINSDGVGPVVKIRTKCERCKKTRCWMFVVKYHKEGDATMVTELEATEKRLRIVGRKYNQPIDYSVLVSR